MRDRHPEPIRSELANDPEFEERIDQFVVDLGERIDMVQEADRAGELKSGAVRLHELSQQARTLGFPLLANCALRAAQSCEQGSASVAHKQIVELTEVAQRVRLGHRGAF